MTFPLTRRYRTAAPAVATTASNYQIVDSANESETVSSVTYIPMAAITGVATNNRSLTLYNRTVTGGTTPIASITFASGTNASDNVPKGLTLSTTSANLLLSANDVFEWESIANGSGIADPGGIVQVNTLRTPS